MTTHYVLITEIVFYRMTVEADDQEAAEVAAREQFVATDNPNRWFDKVQSRDFLAYGESA